ncbi:MAG: VOC family protein [Cypionkella sp.]|uniref:VOC family protein n=1 Tax=Cypionkella sp. TaxID=2811411 RepID=UPI002ABD0606|nr:VOC family protein [Cypionkella sp.]MDZ4312608.1 VOC family protein [Cypionkella sp.]
MLLYITLGTNNLAAAKRFYDATLAPIGLHFMGEFDGEIGYGPTLAENPLVWINQPYDGNPATIGNGSMPAFNASTRAAVDAFYQAALAHGGTDEGAPGLRYSPNFYSCYVRDPDGNKLSAVCTAAE